MVRSTQMLRQSFLEVLSSHVSSVLNLDHRITSPLIDRPHRRMIREFPLQMIDPLSHQIEVMLHLLKLLQCVLRVSWKGKKAKDFLTFGTLVSLHIFAAYLAKYVIGLMRCCRVTMRSATDRNRSSANLQSIFTQRLRTDRPLPLLVAPDRLEVPLSEALSIRIDVKADQKPT